MPFQLITGCDGNTVYLLVVTLVVLILVVVGVLVGYSYQRRKRKGKYTGEYQTLGNPVNSKKGYMYRGKPEEASQGWDTS